MALASLAAQLASVPESDEVKDLLCGIRQLLAGCNKEAMRVLARRWQVPQKLHGKNKSCKVLSEDMQKQLRLKQWWVQLKQELDRERQAKKRKADDEDMHGVSEPVNTVDGDAEPVERLRKKAKNARNALRQAQSLQRKLDNNEIKWDSLGQQERESLEQLASRKLHVNVDKANKAYGHGIARTNDFGFEEGENMCRNVPMEVRAHLRQLRGDPPGLTAVT